MQNQAFFTFLDSLDQQHLKPLRVIGQSDRSLVCECVGRNGKRFIVKSGPSNSLLAEEMKCLNQIRHPGIVSMAQTEVIDNELCILYLEKIPGCSLIELILQEKTLYEGEAALISKQLCSSLNYLHSKGWIHCDIKPDNLMYDREQLRVTIIDFEFAFKRRKWFPQSTGKGTLQYSAPEVRRRSSSGPEIDVWSLGVTIFVLLTGVFPFNEQELVSLEEDFVPPKELSIEAQEFLKRCLESNAKRRASCRELFAHEWHKRAGEHPRAQIYKQAKK